jgi:hypothetical protein
MDTQLEYVVDVHEIRRSQLPPCKGKKKGSNKRGKAFHREEDLIIYIAWLDVSKHAIIGMYKTGPYHDGPLVIYVTCTFSLYTETKDIFVGTSQLGKGFSARIPQYFLENYDFSNTRTHNSIQL